MTSGGSEIYPIEVPSGPMLDVGCEVDVEVQALNSLRRHAFHKALLRLPERERLAVVLRNGLLDDKPMTLEETAQYLPSTQNPDRPVSRNRTRQIENNGLAKVYWSADLKWLMEDETPIQLTEPERLRLDLKNMLFDANNILEEFEVLQSKGELPEDAEEIVELAQMRILVISLCERLADEKGWPPTLALDYVYVVGLVNSYARTSTHSRHQILTHILNELESEPRVTIKNNTEVDFVQWMGSAVAKAIENFETIVEPSSSSVVIKH